LTSGEDGRGRPDHGFSSRFLMPLSARQHGASPPSCSCVVENQYLWRSAITDQEHTPPREQLRKIVPARCSASRRLETLAHGGKPDRATPPSWEILCSAVLRGGLISTENRSSRWLEIALREIRKSTARTKWSQRRRHPYREWPSWWSRGPSRVRESTLLRRWRTRSDHVRRDTRAAAAWVKQIRADASAGHAPWSSQNYALIRYEPVADNIDMPLKIAWHLRPRRMDKVRKVAACWPDRIPRTQAGTDFRRQRQRVDMVGR